MEGCMGAKIFLIQRMNIEQVGFTQIHISLLSAKTLKDLLLTEKNSKNAIFWRNRTIF